MPLYIRDNNVADLAREVQAVTKAATVTEAVRQALQHEKERVQASLCLETRLAKALDLADAMGPTVGHDSKRFMDELWEEA